jgi:integrase
MYCSAFSVIIHSITKLQKAMGHSSINVSLTYLRGLEIAELKEEDMPLIRSIQLCFSS